MKEIHAPNFILANAENAAAGFGLTFKTYDELVSYGIHAFTSGNHIFDKKEIVKTFDAYTRLVRPLNFPNGTPGVGYRIFEVEGHKIAVINLIGRVFMNHSDCPFQAIDALIETIRAETPIILVDFHAEATSEKQAMGYFLDGKVSAVFGTHTHVQTADERILPKGTAYITDLGMTGSLNSILGMEKEPVIKKFFTQMPTRFEATKDYPWMLNGITLSLNPNTGSANDITRVRHIKEHE